MKPGETRQIAVFIAIEREDKDLDILPRRFFFSSANFIHRLKSIFYFRRAGVDRSSYILTVGLYFPREVTGILRSLEEFRVTKWSEIPFRT